MLESIATTFLGSFVELGPGWLLVAGVLVILGWVTYKLLGVYETSRKDSADNKQEMTKISGQMVEQMDRSNTVIENIQHEMSVMNATNQKLCESIVNSQERSAQMARDVHDANIRAADTHDKVEMLYHHLMTK